MRRTARRVRSRRLSWVRAGTVVLLGGWLLPLATSPAVPQGDMAYGAAMYGAMMGSLKSALAHAKALPLGTDFSGTLDAGALLAVHVLSIPKHTDAKSLLVTLTTPTQGTTDISFGIVDKDMNSLADSMTVGNERRCLLPIPDLPKVYVGVSANGQSARYTLRAGLSPHECVAKIPVFVDDLPVLREGGTVEGRLPEKGGDFPGARWYRADLGTTKATVAKLELKAPADQGDVDLGVCGADGTALASVTTEGSVSELRTPIATAGSRLFVAVWLADAPKAETVAYSLSMELLDEEPGPKVLERVATAAPKAFTAGRPVLGQVPGKERAYYGWLTMANRPVGSLLLSPSNPEAKTRLIARNEQGWLIADSEEGAGLRQLSTANASLPYWTLIEVIADRPCGFVLYPMPAETGVPFDAASAQPLACGKTVEGRSGPAKGVAAVYRLDATPSAKVPRITLTVDPVYADLDLLVCASPDAVMWRSENPGGIETAYAPLAGLAPVYVLVTAPEGIDARFRLTAEEVDGSSVPAELYRPTAPTPSPAASSGSGEAGAVCSPYGAPPPFSGG
jgi:hypothetical protein